MVAYTTVVRLFFRYAPAAWAATRKLRYAARLWNDNKAELEAMTENEAESAIRDHCSTL